MTTARFTPSLQELDPRQAQDSRPATQDVPADDLDLASLYEQQCAWPELAEHLLAQADQAVRIEQRAQYLSKAAYVFECRLLDKEGAYFTHAAAVQAAPNHERIGNLERLAGMLGRSDTLPEALRAAAATAPDGASAAAAWTALARWQRIHSAWDACATAAQSALACSPADSFALSELEEAERHLGRWSDLARTLTRRLALWQAVGRGDDAGQRAAKASVWAELANLHEEKLGDPLQALTACQNAIELDASRTQQWAQLERLSENLERPELAAMALERRLAHTPPGPEHIRISLKLAGRWVTLARLEKACLVVETAITLAPEAEVLYEELAQLYGARGCWHQFIDNCWKHVSVASDGHVRARLAFEAGRVLQNRLARVDAAQAAYTEALTHEPHHLNARRGLVGVYRTRGDAESLAESLWELAELSDDRDEKVACFSEAAAILRDSLRDTDRAKAIEARLLCLDPGNESALTRRLNDAHAAAQWQEVLDVFAEASKTKRPSGHFFARAAIARLQLGQTSEALAGFHHADASATPGTAWRVSWVAALLQGEQHQQAAAVARQLLAETSLSAQDRCDVNISVAQACLGLGNAASACKALKAALTAVPYNLRAMGAMAQAHRAGGQLGEAIAWKWSTFDRAQSEADKVAHALEITAWVRDEAHDLKGAHTVLDHALVHLPNAPALLHALLNLHTSQGQWVQAVAVLSRLASIAQQEHRAKYLLTAGKILLHHCQQVPEAIAMFEGALDATPDDSALAARIEQIYFSTNDAAGYERHLRRHLGRVCAGPADLDQETLIWEKFARLYQGPLANPALAAVALEVLAGLNQSPASFERLANAYEAAGGQDAPRAIQIYVQLIQQSSDVAALSRPLRALARVFARTGDLTRSLNVSGALVLIGHATQAEQELAARATNTMFIPPAATLRASAWTKHLYHPSQHQGVSAMVAHLAPAVAAAHARTAKEWGLPARWEQGPDLELESHGYVQRLRHLAAVLGTPLPPLTCNPAFEGIADLVAVDTGTSTKLALVLGNGFFLQRSDTSFAFVMGRLITRLRPEHLLTWPNIVSSEGEFRAVVAAACQLAGRPAVAPPNHAELCEKYVQHLGMHLSPATVETLATVCATLPSEIDAMPGWLQGVEFTSNRAGLLMCRDLISAVTEATTAGFAGANIGQFEVLRDLVAWSVTNEYALFVRYLGYPD